MKTARNAWVVVVSAVALSVVGWGSRISYRSGETAHGMLRLSWRMRAEQNEICRERSPAELAALPVHMRMPRVCESRPVAYRLTLAIDGGRPDTMIVLPAGAKRDRPTYVLRDSLLAPGRHRVAVAFERTDLHENPALRFDGYLAITAGRIELITIADEGDRLTHIGTRVAPVTPNR